MAADTAVFALLAGKLASSPGALAPLPVTAAVAASLTRLALARRAARALPGRPRVTRCSQQQAEAAGCTPSAPVAGAQQTESAALSRTSESALTT